MNEYICKYIDSIDLWFSISGDSVLPPPLPHRGYLAVSGEFRVSQVGGATGIYRVEAGAAAEHPTMSRMAPHNQE